MLLQLEKGDHSSYFNPLSQLVAGDGAERMIRTLGKAFGESFSGARIVHFEYSEEKVLLCGSLFSIWMNDVYNCCCLSELLLLV